jgi:hypothetical protein
VAEAGRSRSTFYKELFNIAFAGYHQQTEFVSQMNEGLQIVRQVGLVPPDGHLLMYLAGGMKKIAHTFNAAGPGVDS